MVVRTGFSIDGDLLRELDRARGDVPRSRVICRLIERYLEESRDQG